MRFPCAVMLITAAAGFAYADVTSDVDEALADREARIENARVEFDKQVVLATRLAISRLETLATASIRRKDSAGTTVIWKRVLGLDSKHARARQYFEKLGVLTAVLKEVGGPAVAPPTGESLARGGLRFDGNGWVLATSVKYDGRTPLTVEAIVSAQRNSGTFQGVLANIHNAGTGLAIQDGIWQFWCHDGETYRRARADKEVEIGETVHIAGVYDGRVVRIYVDGILQKSIEQMSGPHEASPHPFVIGGDPNNTGQGEHFFEGVFHAARVSFSARYTTNFASPRGLAADKDTVAVWKMDEGKGQLLRDSSGNNHHARINGAIWVGKGD